MTKKKIHLCLAHMSGHEMEYIQEAFDTNWVVPLGPNVDAFEEELEAFIGQEKKISALSSGTAAIHLSLIALGVERGDEVICQSFTFAASCNPVVYLGATPVFVDSEPDTWNMDPGLLEEAIKDRIRRTGRKPKAIIPIYLYGMPPRITEIMAIANHYGIPVIEDSAEGLGSQYKGQTGGTFGHFGIISFNGNKIITTSGGGALICPDQKTKERIIYFATQARQPQVYYLHTEIGYNYRMSNICAGIGRGQMHILQEHIAHHRHLCQVYQNLFADTGGVEVHTNPSSDFNSNFWLNTITFTAQAGQAEMEPIVHHLESLGIESRPLWKPMHTQPVYKDAPHYVNGVSEDLFRRGLCIPSGPYVTEGHCQIIAREIKSCLK